MGDTIKNALSGLMDRLSSLRISGGSMKYIIIYAAVLMICVSLYVAGWLFEWVRNGIPNLSELRLFLHEMSSSAWVAVIGFIAKSLVDNDKDGIPDCLEQTTNDGDDVK